ncbi:MAG: 50S ribosomal protein L6 [Alphaproteobacteria bacterium GWF2_58_20]|nr:MAG: 50S ribosomal protein L6 [Alphaproteobacteria bacterium GWF2_58_20]
MSRIGKHPVAVPAGVEVKVNGQNVSVKGKLGQLNAVLPEGVVVKLEGGAVSVQPRTDSREDRSMWGTARTVVNNMVKGVSEGFHEGLEIEGVGFRASVSGHELTMQLGFSHDVKYPIPEGITIKSDRPTHLVISGADKQMVGQVAAEIRGFKRPEPYKGKGIRYEGEVIRRKEGKKK